VFRQVGLLGLQMYEPHEDEVTAGHAPLPSQVAAMVWSLPVQLSCRQPVLLDHGLQAPAPSQVPSLEQSPADATLATQRPLGSAPPVATGKQLPTLPACLQLLHRPVVALSLHALSQHTPSVQKPLTH
jgi:hypothetical protein